MISITKAHHTQEVRVSIIRDLWHHQKDMVITGWKMN